MSGSPAGVVPLAQGEVEHCRFDSGVRLDGEEPLEMAVSLHYPAALSEPAALLICLPGGGMNRRFYDLRPPGDEADLRFSFARQMNAQGFIVASVDHLGIGDSSRPQDGHALHADLLADAAARVRAAIVEQVKTHYGDALSGLRTIGVGHSMGALITVLQQARHRSHHAIAVLGFSTRGLPEYVPPAMHGLAADPVALRAQVPALARTMFKDAYPRVSRGGGASELFAGKTADPAAVAALKAAGDEPLLPQPAVHSMMPGNVEVEAASIDAPVYLGVGDRDMVGPPERVPLAFANSRAVELHVLPQTGHSLFLFPGRVELFETLAIWVRSVGSGCA